MDTAIRIMALKCEVEHIMELSDSPLFLLDKPESTMFTTDGALIYASTVAFSESIYLHPIPHHAFVALEITIEEILEHESLHLAMHSLGLLDESGKFDNLFSSVGDWKKVLK